MAGDRPARDRHVVLHFGCLCGRIIFTRVILTPAFYPDIIRPMESTKKYTAFVGERVVASGALEEVLPKLKAMFDRQRSTLFLIFDDETGVQVDFDLRGTLEAVLARHGPPSPPTGPGRPRLGVTSREITLLPRHWEWLGRQPNGASAAIRRLIDEARKREPAAVRRQQALQATERFLFAMAGNLPGYEEASRALFRGDRERFAELISPWPKDVRHYALRLARGDGFDGTARE
jgi:hypothetical protein